MRKGVPQLAMLGWMVKSSRDGPSLLINLAMSPSTSLGSHHACKVRMVDMSIMVCGPRSQRMNTALLECKHSRRHGDLACNSTALISSSMARVPSGLNVNCSSKGSEDTDTERRFKGEQRRVVKCSSSATLWYLTSTSTKHGRANTARNAALVSRAKRVKGIPRRTSFRNWVSIPSKWGKAEFTRGQGESVLELYRTKKWNSRM